jgi:predicted amidohydrolase
MERQSWQRGPRLSVTLWSAAPGGLTQPLLMMNFISFSLVSFGFLAMPVFAADEAATEPAALRVAAVQMRSSRDLADNVARIRETLLKCATDGVRVAVFPECALTGYYEEVRSAVVAEEVAAAERQVAAACREAGIYAIVGTPHHAGAKCFNSATVITAEGRILERYHKVQLAERWPDPGDHLSVFEIDGVRCSIIICHDERYPELVRLPVLAGARVVFYLSHESGVRSEHKMAPYRAQIQARAVENTVFIVHANAPANADTSGSHGQSRLIAPDGNLIEEASVFEEQVVTATLDLKQATAANALKSLTRGPLIDWWQAGLKRVRLVK